MRNSFPTDTKYFLGYKFLLLTSCRFLLLRSSTDRGILHKASPRATNCAPAFCQGKKSISTCKLHMAKHHFVTQQNGMVITEKKPFLMRFHTFPHITHSRHHRTMQFLSPLSLPDVEKLICVANEWCIIFRFPHVT